MRRFGTQWKEMQTVARYILQRLGQTLLILLIVSFITYLLIDFLPGDPIAAMLGGEISQETYDWWYQELNLDKPVLIRYVLWLKNALMGDFGHSASYSVPVLQIIGERVPVTLYLSVLAFLISVPLGILFGIISAVKRGKPADTAVTLTANICCCLPQFWLGILLMYIFTIVLKWLPSSGWVWPWEDFGESVRRTIMPLTCLTIGGIASITRQTRSSMLEVIRQDYIRTAKSKGLKGKKVICLVSGGNIDVTILSRVIKRGLLMSGRSCRLNIELLDKPGQLKLVSQIIADLGGNVISIHHERANEGSDVNGCFLRVTMETRDYDHIAQIKRALCDAGLKITD